jgi:hypothetical protein
LFRTGVITTVGGSPESAIYQRYSAALAELDNPQDLALLKSKLPNWNDTVTDQDYYASQLAGIGVGAPKETFSSIGYDTIMALGQAACKAANASGGNYFDGKSHFGAIVNHQFQGISGKIILNKETGSREPESATFHIINFVEDFEKKPGENMTGFAEVITDVFEDGHWKFLAPYTFNDGSTTVPPDLPAPEKDYNYIGKPLRAVGLTMATLILLASIGFAIWAHLKRKTRVVRASQPIFLVCRIACLFPYVFA